MDMLNVVSHGFLKSTSSYSVPGILTFGFLQSLGEAGEEVSGIVSDVFEVLRVRTRAVEVTGAKDMDLRKRNFKI